ncbi:MAG: DUF1629 domain-containing protein [Sphingomonas sp.]
MVYSIGKGSVFEIEPENQVIGGEEVWSKLQFLHPEKVDRHAKLPGRSPLGQGYPVVPDSAPKAVLWKSKSKLPPDYAFGDNSIMLVSSRFRDLVERFEPGVHQFLPVDMYNSKAATEPFDCFYWFVVCTLIDSVDPEHTTLTWKGDYTERGSDGLRYGLWYFDHSASPPQKAVFSQRAIGDRHLWRDPYYTRDYVNCSDAFGEAMIAPGLTGFGLRQYEQI